MERQHGFTLIELLVVIAIIGILSSVVLTSLTSARAKGRDARRISDISQLRLALELYYDSQQSYPLESQAFPTDLSTSVLVVNGYISTIPVDPSTSVKYAYAATSCSGAGGGTPCTGYVLRAILETSNVVLQTDKDGTIGGIDCGPATEADRNYCVTQ